MRSVRSRIGIRWVSVLSSGWSNRLSSTRSPYSLNNEKLTPSPSHVAPCGYGRPGHTRISGDIGLLVAVQDQAAPRLDDDLRCLHLDERADPTAGAAPSLVGRGEENLP